MKFIPLALLALFSAAAFAQPAPTMRLRGTIEKIDATSIVIKERNGETMTLALADNVAVNEVLAVDPAAIQSGKFIGTAAVPGADGTLAALEVLVFPEAMRGAGEGYYAWDLEPGSMMTNGTVTGVVEATSGRELSLSFKGSSNKIVVPAGVPIVTFAPAERADLKPGAPVMFGATKNAEGKLAAGRVTVGKDGVAPPM